jgi:hypothetical protein
MGGLVVARSVRSDREEADTTREDRVCEAPGPGEDPAWASPARPAITSALAFLLMAASALLAVDGGVAHAIGCGLFRWDVKTLSDPDRRDVDFNARRTTVRRLRRLDSPGPYDGMPRTGPVEKHVYRVRAQVRLAKLEPDGDIHLVIAPPRARAKTMFVEFPDPRCVDKPFKRPQMRRARNRTLNNCGDLSLFSFTELKGRVRIRGVGFWDEVHGQIGVAPNGIELHPVLSIRGTCSHR